MDNTNNSLFSTATHTPAHHWGYSAFTWEVTNLITPLVQIRGFYDNETQFFTIPMERKATEGSPQNVFSRLFCQYQMSSSMHGRSRSVPFLNCLSWFLAKMQQGCSARASYLPVLLQHPGNRELLLRLRVLFPAPSPTDSIFPASGNQPDVLPWGSPFQN